ncbi:MAG: ABC transporter ATPase [Flavobacteriaceae bacterium]|nr:ABC transporter ATPase [Flavobacteriaceae bacterium]MDG2499732.1 ABC transporter ATPase [Flavobacteriaceae bacterium]
MIIDFKNIPDDSRIWIYQSSKDLSDSDIKIIDNKTTLFLENWKAHGNELQASYLIKERRFLIIAVNERFNPIGGCSIDYSLQLVNDISTTINLNLLDRLSVNYRLENNIKSISLRDLKNKIKNKSFSPETIIFNTTVKTKKELSSDFELKISSSWLSKFF